MAGHTASIEFRHRSWLDEAHRAGTIEFLRKLGAVHTIVDGPQGFANSVPLLAETTTDYALVRLHGRNVDIYNIESASSAAERFDYDYPDQELREIMAEVVRLAYKAKHTHIIFNNCDEDKSQRNAQPLTAQRHHVHEDAAGSRLSSQKKRHCAGWARVQLHEVEREVQALEPDARRRIRQLKSKPVADLTNLLPPCSTGAKRCDQNAGKVSVHCLRPHDQHASHHAFISSLHSFLAFGGLSPAWGRDMGGRGEPTGVLESLRGYAERTPRQDC
jgi:hypothetical protein